MSCIKRQAEDFVEFCEENWSYLLKELGRIEVNPAYFEILSKIKNKDYSKLKRKIEDDSRIETKNYTIHYDDNDDGEMYIIVTRKIKMIELKDFYYECVEKIKKEFDLKNVHT